MDDVKDLDCGCSGLKTQNKTKTKSVSFAFLIFSLWSNNSSFDCVIYEWINVLIILWHSSFFSFTSIYGYHWREHGFNCCSFTFQLLKLRSTALICARFCGNAIELLEHICLGNQIEATSPSSLFDNGLIIVIKQAIN